VGPASSTAAYTPGTDTGKYAAASPSSGNGYGYHATSAAVGPTSSIASYTPGTDTGKFAPASPSSGNGYAQPHEEFHAEEPEPAEEAPVQEEAPAEEPEDV